MNRVSDERLADLIEWAEAAVLLNPGAKYHQEACALLDLRDCRAALKAAEAARDGAAEEARIYNVACAKAERERDAALQRAESAEAALRNAPDASRNAGYTVVADPASKNEA